jgi:hypothetical protein
MANGDAPPSTANVGEAVEDFYPQYMLDDFLGEFDGADDAEKIQFMSVDISDFLYGLRKFIWDEIRLFSALKELTIVYWEDDDVFRDELMLWCEQSLALVARENPEWLVPKITVVTVQGVVWGTLGV